MFINQNNEVEEFTEIYQKNVISFQSLSFSSIYILSRGNSHKLFPDKAKRNSLFYIITFFFETFVIENKENNKNKK